MRFAATIIQITLLEAWRARLPWVGIATLIIAFGTAAFLDQVSLMENAQIQAALLGAVLRAAAVFGATAFVITSMVRESNDRVTELLVSQPVPRSAYFLGKFLGYSIVAWCLALLFALPLTLYSTGLSVAAWALSLACELLIVTAVGLFCVVSLGQILPALAATTGFYLLGRSMQTMQAIASAPHAGETDWTDIAVKWIVDAIALLMPSLDRMTLTSWLVESPPSAAEMGHIVLLTIVYVGFIGSAALFDFYRKSF